VIGGLAVTRKHSSAEQVTTLALVAPFYEEFRFLVVLCARSPPWKSCVVEYWSVQPNLSHEPEATPPLSTLTSFRAPSAAEPMASTLAFGVEPVGCVGRNEPVLVLVLVLVLQRDGTDRSACGKSACTANRRWMKAR